MEFTPEERVEMFKSVAGHMNPEKSDFQYTDPEYSDSRKTKVTLSQDSIANLLENSTLSPHAKGVLVYALTFGELPDTEGQSTDNAMAELHYLNIFVRTPDGIEINLSQIQ